MPDSRTPEYITPANLEAEPFKFGFDPLSKAYALAILENEFPQYESYRSVNHDPRWNINDSLFAGWMPAKVWDGTNVSRAHLPQQIVFDQIQAAVPAIYNALFGIGPEWFDVEAEPGTDPMEARLIQASLSYFLEHPKDDYGRNAKAELVLAFLNMCLYGNGGIEIYWDSLRKRPIVQWVDIRDFYIDPGASSPDVEEARSIYRRKFMTVEEVKDLARIEGFQIPDEAVLNELSRFPIYTVADQTKRGQEAMRLVSWQPGASDYTGVPNQRKMEVLIRYTNKKVIWYLNRQLVIYNQDNPYGFYPFAFAPCFIYTSRFYAMSIGDVQEGNQRYMEALLNGRLDEISLMLRPPRAMKQGMLSTPQNAKWAPGQTMQVGNVKEDIALLSPANNLANIYSELQYIEQMAEKRTGINAMSQGTPRGGNVNRTATGVSAQMAGANNRLQQLVSNIEDYLITPMLYKMYMMIRFHTSPQDQMPVMQNDGNFGSVGAGVYQKRARFRMSASSRMVTKQQLQQNFPFLVQYLLNGSFMGALQQMGQTVDFGQLVQMLQDATGVSNKYKLVRALTPQEKQMMHQAQQQQQNPEMEKAKFDAQTKKEIAQMQIEGTLKKVQMEKMPNEGELEIEREKAQLEMQVQQQKMQIEAQKAQLELQAQMIEAKQKAESEQVMNRIKIQAEAEKNAQKNRQMQLEMGMKAQEAQFSMASMSQQHEAEMNMQRDQMSLDRERGQMDMDHQKQMGEMKLKGEKDSQAIKKESMREKKNFSKEKYAKAKAGK